MRPRGWFDPIWIGYLGATILLSPLLLAYGAWRFLAGGSRTGRTERLGFGPPLPAARHPRLWLHGVSVGEIQSLEPIVDALLELRPELELVVSSETATGWERARELFGGRAWVRFQPVDLPWAVAGAMRRVRPDLMALQESELWPSLLRYGARCGPIVIVNGRISDRTFRRAQRVRRLNRWMLDHLSMAGVQSELDAERLRELGMRAGAIRVTGSTKFDRDGPVAGPDERARWRRLLRLGEHDPVLVAGSTFPGEEEILVRALLRVRERRPGARLILAPRKVERAQEVLRVAENAGLPALLRSRAGSGGPAPGSSAGAAPAHDRAAPAVVVLDTIGELATVYGAGELAFVGRSLAHGGGQSPVEPMAAGLPVLHGPRMENFRQVTRDAIEAGAARTVRTGEELAAAWEELLADPELRRSMGSAGQQLVARSRGAARRSAELILEVLDGS